MKLSVSAYRAHASAHKKILSSSYHTQLNYGSTGAAATSNSSSAGARYTMENNESITPFMKELNRSGCNSDTDVISPTGTSSSGQEPNMARTKSKPTRAHKHDDDNNSNAHSSESRSPVQKKKQLRKLSHQLFSRSTSSSTTRSQSNNSINSSATNQTNSIRNYTERDRLTLSDHQPRYHHNRRHVQLVLNSPESVQSTESVGGGMQNTMTGNNDMTAAAGTLNSGYTKDCCSAPLNAGGTQKWKSLRAVMAYYCSLRRIKRNGAFHFT